MALISKVKIGETAYDLKDAQSRSTLTTLIGDNTLAALGTAAWRAVTTEISDGNGKIADAATVKAYVDAQVDAIPSFDVVVVEELPTASADTFHKIYLMAQSRTATTNIYDEYITIRSGSTGSYSYSWEKIGSTETDLSGYVKKTQKIATIDLNDDITASELQTALGLKAMAYADKASGTVAGQTISGIKATADKIESTISGELNYTPTNISSTATYTPEGTISRHTPAGTVTVALKDATTATNATLTRENYTPAGDIATSVAVAEGDKEANYTPAGTISKPNITPNNTTANIGVMTNAGTSYTLKGGSVVKAEDTKDTFAKEGLKASIGTGDDAETLIFSAASTASAVTAAGEVTYTGPELNGSLPTFETKSVLTDAAPALAETPVFSGTGVVISDSFTGTTATGLKVTGATYLKQVVDAASTKFTGEEFQPSFNGTQATITATGSYDKANKGTLAASATKVSLDVGDITVTEKAVEVSPVTQA